MSGGDPQGADVIVVCAGNAALCAAISAAEAGASVLVLERAPQANRGGNSAFSGDAFRVAYDGIDDIRKLVPDLSQEDADNTDFGTYPRGRFFHELMALSGFKASMPLTETVVDARLATMPPAPQVHEAPE